MFIVTPGVGDAAFAQAREPQPLWVGSKGAAHGPLPCVTQLCCPLQARVAASGVGFNAFWAVEGSTGACDSTRGVPEPPRAPGRPRGTRCAAIGQRRQSGRTGVMGIDGSQGVFPLRHGGIRWLAWVIPWCAWRSVQPRCRAHRTESQG